jgi:hypothetical protein
MLAISYINKRDGLDSSGSQHCLSCSLLRSRLLYPIDDIRYGLHKSRFFHLCRLRSFYPSRLVRIIGNRILILFRVLILLLLSNNGVRIFDAREGETKDRRQRTPRHQTIEAPLRAVSKSTSNEVGDVGRKSSDTADRINRCS